MITIRKNRSRVYLAQHGYNVCPLPEPGTVRHDHKPECAGCPYARHGLTCYDPSGSCLRDDMDKATGRARP